MAVVEATWASVLLSAAVDSVPGQHVRLPFVVVAPGAVVSVGVAVAVRRRWRGWTRRVTIGAPAFVAGVAITAGLISEVTVSGSFVRVATHPWTPVDHRVAVVGAAALWVAILAWGRGAWLGLAPPSFQHAVRSAVVSALVFVGIFAGRADSSAHVFRTLTGSAGWLFFVAFPLGVAMVALARERDLAAEVLRSPGAGPGATWVTVLAVPVLAVAVLALGVAAAVGPVAPDVGHAIVWLVRAIGAAIAWLSGLLASRGSPRHAVSPSHLSSPHLVTVPPIAARPPAGAGLPGAVWDVIGVVLVAAVVVWLARHFHWLGRLPVPREDAEVEEERDSVFTLDHFLAQLRAWLWRLFGRFFPRLRPPEPGGSNGGLVGIPERTEELDAVRRAYRSMLTGLASTGAARTAAETPRELGDRLLDLVASEASQPVERLTTLYEAVRYGELPVDGPAGRSASDDAETIVGQLPSADSAPGI
jgi:hypothetical protein